MTTKPKPPRPKVGDLRRHPRGYDVRVVKITKPRPGGWYSDCYCLYVREPWVDGCRPVEVVDTKLARYPLLNPAEPTP
jgi:hypothetical protein